MNRLGLRLSVLGLGLALSGCGLFHDKGQDYRQAELSKPLKLPPGMQSDAMVDKYGVPGIAEHQGLTGKFQVPPPEPIARNVGRSEVRIQRMDGESWILMDGIPGQVWPQMRAFMKAANLEIARANVDQGILETHWLQPNSGGPSERYRFRIEEGVQVGTSEVHVLHAQDDGTNRWPKRSANAERELELTKLLAQFLASSQGKHSAISVLAERGAGVGKGKIFMEGEGEQAYLRVLLPQERAWGALGLALEKAGFEIEESSTEVNKYWVTYLPPQTKDPGWFRNFFFGAARPPVARYVIEMKSVAEEQSLVYLNYQKGRRLRETERKQVLTRIMGYLY